MKRLARVLKDIPTYTRPIKAIYRGEIVTILCYDKDNYQILTPDGTQWVKKNKVKIVGR